MNQLVITDPRAIALLTRLAEERGRSIDEVVLDLADRNQESDPAVSDNSILEAAQAFWASGVTLGRPELTYSQLRESYKDYIYRRYMEESRSYDEYVKNKNVD
jgi:hypothetical protein